MRTVSSKEHTTGRAVSAQSALTVARCRPAGSSLISLLAHHLLCTLFWVWVPWGILCQVLFLSLSLLYFVFLWAGTVCYIWVLSTWHCPHTCAGRKDRHREEVWARILN